MHKTGLVNAFLYLQLMVILWCVVQLFRSNFCGGAMCVLVMRDINEHKRPLEQILNQYTKFVKPAFEEFCLPVCLKKKWFRSFCHQSLYYRWNRVLFFGFIVLGLLIRQWLWWSIQVKIYLWTCLTTMYVLPWRDT